MQYSKKRLPVALYGRPLVAAADQGAVFLMCAPMTESRITAWPLGVGMVPLESHERPRELAFSVAVAPAVKLQRTASIPSSLPTEVFGAKITPEPRRCS